MKLLVFGATGETGTVLVNQALDARHSVTAFVRDPARVRRAHHSLRTAVGDVMDPASVLAAMPGQEAVICTLGTMPESRADRARRQPGVPVCSVGTWNILGAMARHAVRRIVVESSACVGDSRRTGRFGAGQVVHFVLRDVMNDKERQECHLRESAAEWTIIRPVRLFNGARTGRVTIGDAVAWGLTSRVSRADVAAVMLGAVADESTVKRAITVCSGVP